MNHLDKYRRICYNNHSNDKEHEGPFMNKAEKIWTEYSRMMLGIARGFFGDTPDAEDAVSQSVERILRHLDMFGEVPSSRSRGLCAVITKNVCRDILRKRTEPEDEESYEDEDADSALPSAEDVWFSAQTVAGVRRCIEELPDAYADLLRMKLAYGLTPKQIAGMLGITEANARTRLHRARAALLKRMREEGWI